MQTDPIIIAMLGNKPTISTNPLAMGSNLLTPIQKKIHLKDTRLIDAATGNKITDKNKLDESVEVGMAKDIISKAKRSGIDPYTALAMAHQETGYADKDNPFHISDDYDDNSQRLDKKNNGDSIQSFMDMFNNKKKLADRLGKKDEASIIQAWNGYGKINKNSEDGTSNYYGIDVSKNPIDMNTNPVYGKRVIDIRENIIKKNPELVSLINSTK